MGQMGQRFSETPRVPRVRGTRKIYKNYCPICPICPSKDMIILTFKRFLLNTIMKAKSLQQIADSAGVSVRTLRRWLVPHKQQLASLGLKPSMKAIPPSAVKYIAEIFCLDIE